MFKSPVGIETGIPGEYLIEALFHVGPSAWSEGAEVPISWAELAGYMAATGDISEPWEARAVMAMSKAYVNAKREGVNVHCIPPVERETE